MIGSLFSGIGGLELGLEAAGLGPTAYQVENNPSAIRILSRHWPDVYRWPDVQTFVPPVWCDVICGGAPCQDLSSANVANRQGLNGAKSGLVTHTLRIIGHARPTWGVLENVANWRDWVPYVRESLHRIGYTSVSLSLRACDIGAPFRGTRVFVVTTPYGNGKSVATLNAKASGLPSLARLSWGDWGFPTPDGMGMAYGFSDRLERVGNAVMPRMSYVIGRFIRECMTSI